ncbi:hypothetical protein ES708_21322 [subsurface metagenome]
MTDQEFDFKKTLQEMLIKIKEDPSLTKILRKLLHFICRSLHQILTKNLVPAQKKILDAMLEVGGLLLFGCRKTGKTYLDALGAIILGTQKTRNDYRSFL